MKTSILIFILLITSCKEEKIFQQDDEKILPYYEKSKVEVDSMFAKLNKINLGDSINIILDVIGQPCYDQISATKEKNEFIFRSLKYYIKKWDNNLVNVNDEYIQLLFDKNDKLVEIFSNVENNILEIKNK